MLLFVFRGSYESYISVRVADQVTSQYLGIHHPVHGGQRDEKQNVPTALR